MIEALELAPGKIIIDCTVGLGGHAEAILDKIIPGGKLVGIDKDTDALEFAKNRLSRFGESVLLVRGDFDDLRAIFERSGVEKADGFLFDLGVSSLQFDSADRGFSFRYDSPLDMRMDKEGEASAYDIINGSGEAELSWILEHYGEERFSRRIVRAIAARRKTAPIKTTGELVDIIMRAVPYMGRHGRVHPATRTFQALRIAVNKELTAMEAGLDDAIDLLNPLGLICVISYHSLEDRIAKNKFKAAKAGGTLELIYKKPLTPGEAETEENPRSRSAKMRLARKVMSNEL